MPTPSATPPRGKRFIGLIILLTIIVSVIGYLVYQTISSGKAALQVEANPTAIVYINDEQRGRTPFEQEIETGEIVLKLVPENTTTPLSPYETKVKLTEGVKTVVRRNFGESTEDASGQIISFEKKAANETSLAVVSYPDGVEVSIDGIRKGVTPLKTEVSAGKHDLKLTASGYEDSTFSVQAVPGYSTTAIVELRQVKQLESIDTPDVVLEDNSPEDPSNQALRIRILDTSVGYLRVRSEPDIQSQELGRVAPGDEFEVLETSADEAWYKIAFEDENEGWVSAEFAQTLGNNQTADE